MSSEAARMLRLFFAIWPDAAARAALHALARDLALEAQGRAIRADNLHVTLAFLGNIAHERIATLADVGMRASRATMLFPLRLERLGGGSSALTWLAPERVPPALAALHDALASGLSASGFAIEQRVFRPHVTLVRDGVRRPGRATLAAVEWRVDRLSLVASRTAPGGSVYRELHAWPLGHAGS